MSKARTTLDPSVLDQWDLVTAMSYCHMGENTFRKTVIPWLSGKQVEMKEGRRKTYRSAMRKDGLFDKKYIQEFMSQDNQYYEI